MKINELKKTMRMLHENDPESYDELWNSVRTLYSLGLVEKNVVDAMVKEDHKLFQEEMEADEDMSQLKSVKITLGGYGLHV